MKFLGLIRANLFRKKIRFILTIGSFAVALFLFGVLAVVKMAFSRVRTWWVPIDRHFAQQPMRPRLVR